MSLDAVRRIADAVLYEGYILYPYRASAQKNRSRWQFGVVMPPGYTAVDPSESAFTQTECVLEHSGQPIEDARVAWILAEQMTKVRLLERESVLGGSKSQLQLQMRHFIRRPVSGNHALPNGSALNGANSVRCRDCVPT